MTFWLLIAAVLAVAFALLRYAWWSLCLWQMRLSNLLHGRGLGERARWLKQRGYLMGRSIEEMSARLRRGARTAELWNGRTAYAWGYGEATVWLHCDGLGIVVDYGPPKAAADEIRSFFARQDLTGWHVNDVRRAIGHYDQDGAFDHGISLYYWRLGRGSGVKLYTLSEYCSEAVVEGVTVWRRAEPEALPLAEPSGEQAVDRLQLAPPAGIEPASET